MAGQAVTAQHSRRAACSPSTWPSTSASRRRHVLRELRFHRGLRKPRDSPNCPPSRSHGLLLGKRLSSLFSHISVRENWWWSFSFEVPYKKDETETESSIESLASRVTDWKSIRLMMFVILLTRVQFTVYFASLWPFLQEVCFMWSSDLC